MNMNMSKIHKYKEFTGNLLEGEWGKSTSLIYTAVPIRKSSMKFQHNNSGM